MTPYPKHYLADVPHDFRMHVLDLCMRREWHDALDLLNQNGFTQYEWYELVWFHDHAPTNLDPVPGPACPDPVGVPSAPSDLGADGPSALECGLPPANASTPLSGSPKPEPPPLTGEAALPAEQIVNRRW